MNERLFPLVLQTPICHWKSLSPLPAWIFFNRCIFEAGIALKHLLQALNNLANSSLMLIKGFLVLLWASYAHLSYHQSFIDVFFQRRWLMEFFTQRENASGQNLTAIGDLSVLCCILLLAVMMILVVYNSA